MKAPECHVRGGNLGAVCDSLTLLRAEPKWSFFTMAHGQKVMLCFLWLWEGNLVCLYLLSDHIGVMAGLDFEGAIICPQVNGIGDACYTSLVYLRMSASPLGWLRSGTAYQLCSLGPRNGKFEICIFFPVPKQQRELGKETIIYVSSGGDGLGTGVSVETSLERFCSTHELFPVFEAIRFFELYVELAKFWKSWK